MENYEAQFDVESVARTNKLDKVKLDILQRRQSTINSFKEYTRYRAKGYDEKGLIDFQIELGSLYMEVRQMIIREIANDNNRIYPNIESLESDIESDEAPRVIKAFNYIESLLYKKRITQIDTREAADPTDIFGMNEKGYY